MSYEISRRQLLQLLMCGPAAAAIGEFKGKVTAQVEALGRAPPTIVAEDTPPAVVAEDTPHASPARHSSTLLRLDGQEYYLLSVTMAQDESIRVTSLDWGYEEYSPCGGPRTAEFVIDGAHHFRLDDRPMQACISSSAYKVDFESFVSGWHHGEKYDRATGKTSFFTRLQLRIIDGITFSEVTS